jgi:predicted methyltransferase
MAMWSAVGFCHRLLRERLRPGDWAVDATAGNGHDTLLLTQLTGPDGKVYAFDIQAEAIAATARLLADSGIPPTTFTLITASHENMSAHLPAGAHGQLAALLFNLGYLPGGDKSVITHPASTLSGLRDALLLLRPGGLLLLVLYPGHPGGALEAEAVRAEVSGLSPRLWQITEHRALNTAKPAPFVIVVEKLAETCLATSGR